MHYITQNQGENAGFTVNVFSFIVQVTLTAINLARTVVCWISIHTHLNVREVIDYVLVQ
jgi:hypothetical protein